MAGGDRREPPEPDTIESRAPKGRRKSCATRGICSVAPSGLIYERGRSPGACCRCAPGQTLPALRACFASRYGWQRRRRCRSRRTSDTGLRIQLSCFVALLMETAMHSTRRSAVSFSSDLSWHSPGKTEHGRTSSEGASLSTRYRTTAVQDNRGSVARSAFHG